MLIIEGWSDGAMRFAVVGGMLVKYGGRIGIRVKARRMILC